jgi:hypothetical protein
VERKVKPGKHKKIWWPCLVIKKYLGKVSSSGCASQYAWVRFLAIVYGLVPCEKRPKDKSEFNTNQKKNPLVMISNCVDV